MDFSSSKQILKFTLKYCFLKIFSLFGESWRLCWGERLFKRGTNPHDTNFVPLFLDEYPDDDTLLNNLFRNNTALFFAANSTCEPLAFTLPKSRRMCLFDAALTNDVLAAIDTRENVLWNEEMIGISSMSFKPFNT